jgi:hypothetical protein
MKNTINIQKRPGKNHFEAEVRRNDQLLFFRTGNDSKALEKSVRYTIRKAHEICGVNQEAIEVITHPTGQTNRV